MQEDVIHAGVEATIARLTTSNPALKPLLDHAYGYAVFPTVGRASAVLGGAHGYGEVFEQGKPIGFASMGQLTVGVQLGGQTFSELVLFKDKDALKTFKKGDISFTANASAVIVKAGATRTSDFHSLDARAYSLGGMLLEASIGGQKLTFREHLGEPKKGREGEDPGEPQGQAQSGTAEGASDEGQAQAGAKPGDQGTRNGAEGGSSSARSGAEEAAGHVEQKGEEAPQPEAKSKEKRGRLANLGRRVAGKVTHFVSEHTGAAHGLNRAAVSLAAKRHPTLVGKPVRLLKKINTAASGLEKEAKMGPALSADVQAALRRMTDRDPGLKGLLDKAYGYAVFPLVGKAATVVGVGFGRGQVFERGSLIGYAGIVQVTAGVQIGGQTYDELIVFENKGALERFKSGKLAFAANASAVIVSAGAAATTNYSSGTAVFVHPDGGLMIELGLGGQKFIFRKKVLGAPGPKPKGDGEERRGGQADEQASQAPNAQAGGASESSGGGERAS